MSTSAADLLASHGLTVQQARDFIFANLDHLDVVMHTAAQHGVTNAMLAEIVGEGFTATDVQNYFASHGLASAHLDMPAFPIVTAEMASFAPLVAPNTGSGLLSTDALRAQVIADTDANAYMNAFNPDAYESVFDGTFTPAELGVSHLGDLPATQQMLESLFFGFVVNAMKNIDANEMADVFSTQAFLLANIDAIAEGDEALAAQFIGQLDGILGDAAETPALSDEQIAGYAVLAGTYFVNVAGSGPEFAISDGVYLPFL